VLVNTAPVRDTRSSPASSGALHVPRPGRSYRLHAALIFVNARLVGHILVGYLGSSCSASAVSIGLFASAFARTQVIAAVLGAALLASCSFSGWRRRYQTPGQQLRSLARHPPRAATELPTGVLSSKTSLYYLAVTYFFLLAAIKTLEARRWR
jgi:hypothetical protein